MKPSKTVNLIKPLLSKPSFTAKEARACGVHPSLLHYYVNKGVLKQVRRGVYRDPKAPAEPEPTTFQWMDLIEYLRLIPGGTVCLISALAIYGLTEEITRDHWIAIDHNTTSQAKRNVRIRIVRYRNAKLGKTTMDLDGVQIPIYDRERTIIDAFRMLSREIAIKALKAAMHGKGRDKLNLVKLQNYAKKLRVPIEPYLLAVTT